MFLTYCFSSLGTVVHTKYCLLFQVQFSVFLCLYIRHRRQVWVLSSVRETGLHAAGETAFSRIGAPGDLFITGRSCQEQSPQSLAVILSCHHSQLYAQKTHVLNLRQIAAEKTSQFCDAQTPSSRTPAGMFYQLEAMTDAKERGIFTTGFLLQTVLRKSMLENKESKSPSSPKIDLLTLGREAAH